MKLLQIQLRILFPIDVERIEILNQLIFLHLIINPHQPKKSPDSLEITAQRPNPLIS